MNNEFGNGATTMDVLAFLHDNVDRVLDLMLTDQHGRLFVEDFLDFAYDDFEAFLEAHREEATASSDAKAV